MEEKLPDCVLKRLECWTKDPAVFSKAVLRYARVRPHSNAYMAGDVSGSESMGMGRERENAMSMNPSTAFNIAWHRRIVGDTTTASSARMKTLSELHAATMLSMMRQTVKDDPNFKAEPDRYPVLHKLIE